jgi:competence protein ComEA
VSDLDRPRLALYVALGLVVCFLGARYLRTQMARPAGGEVAVAGRSATAPVREARGTPTVRLERSDGGRATIHVAGAVRRPGVYALPAGSRVDDAVRRAGGASRGADLTAINLAAKLEDGRQVVVPVRAPAPATATAGAGGGAASAGVGRGGVGAGGGATAGAGGRVAGAGGGVGAVGPAAPVNLNTATLEQLDTLDGVGPGIAQRILDYRAQHGGFRRVEELGEVPGIGDKRLATLTPLVTV